MVFLTDGNMKKQLYRVKQLADQKFAGAEKTEMLNDDLVNKEKQVDILRQVCLNTSKQTRGCLQGQGTDGASLDKRLKKLPDFNLGSTMLECGASLWESSILGQVLGLCGRLQCDLSQHVLTYEVEVERLVLAKYVEILDLDIPNISKLRKQLKSFTLDYDSAKSRYSQLVRQSTPIPANKIDSVKQEYDEAKQKVESCKDTLATELYAVLAKETDLARCLYQLMTSQADYHRRALQVLELSIPSISNAIHESHGKPAYGVLLEEHLEATNSRIAVPIEKSICCLLQYGIEEEGILRIAGSSSKVKKLKNSFDVGIVDMNDYDPPAIAGAMKQYLRELPEPLMTFQLYEEWMDIAKCLDRETKLEAIKLIIPNLPKANYDNLRYLIKFLAKVVSYQDVNKMSSQNVAIVIAINLIWSPDEEQLGMNMGLANTRSAIVDLLITHADELFPGEEDFGVNDCAELASSQQELSASSSTCDINDDDQGFIEINSNLTSEITVEEKQAPVVKNPLPNESLREGGSPKPGRRKKQAPPVPPLPVKDNSEKHPFEKSRLHSNPDERPIIAFKPRHIRTSSGVSLDLSTPGSTASTSDFEGASNSSSSKEQSIGDEVISEPILRSNFRASLPIGLKVNEDVDTKSSSFRGVARASVAMKERSNSNHEVFLSKALDIKDSKDEKTEEFIGNSDLQESLLNGKKFEKNTNGGNHHVPPGRPPRPQVPSLENVGHVKDQTKHKPEVPEKDSTINAEVKISPAARNAYVNLPPNVEVFKSQDSISLEEFRKNNEPLVLNVLFHDDSMPPERPTKYDKSKVIPPVRPEKSDRLRSMIDSKQLTMPILKNRANEDTLPIHKSQISNQNKEKPQRPPPCLALVESEKYSSANVVSPVKTERIYPALSELELVNPEDDANMPKPATGSSTQTSESPVPPKRNQRPQPQPRTYYPTAKPRSVTGVNNPEHTHL